MSEQIIGEVGDKDYPTRIKLSEYQGKQVIDIRKHFTDKNGEIKPTRKGVTFTRTSLYPILKILANNIQEINDFFDVNNDQDNISKRFDDMDLGDLILERIESHKFFKVEKLGSHHKASINSSHPFGKKFEDLIKEIEEIDKELANDIENLLLVILKTYFFAKSHFEPEEYYTADSLFTDHEISWSSKLRREFNNV